MHTQQAMKSKSLCHATVLRMFVLFTTGKKSILAVISWCVCHAPRRIFYLREKIWLRISVINRLTLKSANCLPCFTMAFLGSPLPTTSGLGNVAIFRVTQAWTDAEQRYEDENIFCSWANNMPDRRTLIKNVIFTIIGISLPTFILVVQLSLLKGQHVKTGRKYPAATSK